MQQPSYAKPQRKVESSQAKTAVQMAVLPEEESPFQGPFLVTDPDDLYKSHLLLLPVVR